MIADPDPQVRSDGYEKIFAARKKATGCIRQMFRPQENHFINFESDSYFNMIYWIKFKLTGPPCLQTSWKHYNIQKYQAYPCHSHNTERFGQVVHESAMAVTVEQRMGHILSKLESRLESRRNKID